MNDTTHSFETAAGLVGRARTLALAAARDDPASTWIDAFAAIDQCLSQLAIAAESIAGEPGLVAASAGGDLIDDLSCVELLDQAERALDQVPPEVGPPSLALVRAYLTEAILETSGRAP